MTMAMNKQTQPLLAVSLWIFSRVCWVETGQIGLWIFSIYAPGLGIFSRMRRLGLLFVLLPLMRLKQPSLILRRTKPLGQMGSPRDSLKLHGQWGDEVSNAIRDFFKTGRLLKQLNATLLTLIPKVRNPQSVAEFRPISCCNVIYKAITKILVSRIREILDLLISPSQNAFVPGRLISDNILLAQELFSGYNQCRLPPRCALKVDLRKAYDTVEWDFLFATLRMFGFPAVL
ncbi:UNVERIFIED_CONTAM: hypothetical protein Scaly_2954500 [Sesamum calycinum]|uniref:Reverse transcriptase domain-containing protein n=1 Tax=Sesamum calycinum TaxID=2727403 RepID=A0AAW2KWQ7_9LAMI